MDFSYHTLPFTFKCYAFCETEICEKVLGSDWGFYLESLKKTVYDVTTTLLGQRRNKFNLSPWIFSKKTQLSCSQSMTMNNWRWVGNFSAGSRQLSHHQSRLSTIKSISSGFLWQLCWPRLHGEFNAVYFEKNQPQQTDGALYEWLNRSTFSKHGFWILFDWYNNSNRAECRPFKRNHLISESEHFTRHWLVTGAGSAQQDPGDSNNTLMIWREIPPASSGGNFWLEICESSYGDDVRLMTWQ